MPAIDVLCGRLEQVLVLNRLSVNDGYLYRLIADVEATLEESGIDTESVHVRDGALNVELLDGTQSAIAIEALSQMRSLFGDLAGEDFTVSQGADQAIEIGFAEAYIDLAVERELRHYQRIITDDLDWMYEEPTQVTLRNDGHLVVDRPFEVSDRMSLNDVFFPFGAFHVAAADAEPYAPYNYSPDAETWVIINHIDNDDSIAIQRAPQLSAAEIQNLNVSESPGGKFELVATFDDQGASQLAHIMDNFAGQSLVFAHGIDALFRLPVPREAAGSLTLSGFLSAEEARAFGETLLSGSPNGNLIQVEETRTPACQRETVE